MKTNVYYILLLLAAIFIVAGSGDAKQAKEEKRLYEDIKKEEDAEAHADSLGLTGQDRINFINNYHNGY